MVVMLAKYPGAHFLHHVEAGAEGQPETNQRHHQDHVVAEIIDNQLHYQYIETGQHHPDDAPDRADHRPAIVHREQDQIPAISADSESLRSQI